MGTKSLPLILIAAIATVIIIPQAKSSDVAKTRIVRQLNNFQGFTDPSKFQENFSPDKVTSNFPAAGQFSSMFPGGSGGSGGSSAETPAASEVKYRYARQLDNFQGFTDPSKFQENFSPDKVTSNFPAAGQFSSMFPGTGGGAGGSAGASPAASEIKYRFARQLDNFQGFTDPSKFQENFSPDKVTSNFPAAGQFSSMFPGTGGGAGGSAGASPAASEIKYRFARQLDNFQGFTDPSKFQENFSPDKVTSNFPAAGQFSSMFPGSSGAGGSSGSSPAASEMKFRYARQLDNFQGFTDPSKFQENFSPDKVTSNFPAAGQFSSMFPGSSGAGGSSGSSPAASEIKYRYARQLDNFQGFTDPSKFQENFSPDKVTSNFPAAGQFSSMFPGSSGAGGSSGSSPAASEMKYRYARQLDNFQGFTDPSKFQENFSPDKVTSNFPAAGQFSSMFPGSSGAGGSSGSSPAASEMKYRYARQLDNFQGFTDPSKFQENFSPDKVTSNFPAAGQFSSMFPGSSGAGGSSGSSPAASEIKYRYARQLDNFQGFTDPSKFQENFSPDKVTSNFPAAGQFSSMFPGSSGAGGSSGSSPAASEIKYRYARQLDNFQGFTDPSKFQENFSPDKVTSNFPAAGQFSSMFPGSSGAGGSSGSSPAASDIKYRYARQLDNFQGFTDPSKFQENFSPDKVTSSFPAAGQFSSMFPGSSGAGGSSGSSPAASEIKYRYARQLNNFQGFTDPSKFQENFSPDKVTSNFPAAGQFSSMFPGNSGSAGATAPAEGSS